MKPKYKRTVDSGDLMGTRISLANEMMLDPRGRSFKVMRTYAESAFPNLYEPHDGAILEDNRDRWNENLLFETRNALDDNFSRERLDLYYIMARAVLADKARSLDAQERKEQSQKPQNVTHRNGTSASNKNPLYIGVAVGGLLVGGTGLLMGRAAVAALGLVCASIGGGLIYKNSRR